MRHPPPTAVSSPPNAIAEANFTRRVTVKSILLCVLVFDTLKAGSQVGDGRWRCEAAILRRKGEAFVAAEVVIGGAELGFNEHRALEIMANREFVGSAHSAM